MGIIKPTKEGKTYSLWQILMNFSIFSMENELDEAMDLGLRISIVNNSWISIESFIKDCLYEYIMRFYNDISFPNTSNKDYVLSLVNSTKTDFKLSENTDFHDLELKEIFSSIVKKQSWYPLLTICNDLQLPIEKKISQWEFLQNLYRLRNGITHGQGFRIMKSNFEHFEDEISEEYIKSIRYLNGKKVINISKIIETQDINEIVNKKLSDFIVTETAKAFDDLSKVFEKTTIAQRWIINMRKNSK